MKPNEIDYLKQLNESFSSGTITQVLLDGDLQRSTFVGVLKHLLETTLGEKKLLQDENSKLFKACKESGLDLNQILFGG